MWSKYQQLKKNKQILTAQQIQTNTNKIPNKYQQTSTNISKNLQKTRNLDKSWKNTKYQHTSTNTINTKKTNSMNINWCLQRQTKSITFHKWLSNDQQNSKQTSSMSLNKNGQVLTNISGINKLSKRKNTNANIHEQRPKHNALTNINKYQENKQKTQISSSINKCHQYYTAIHIKKYKKNIYHQTPPCQTNWQNTYKYEHISTNVNIATIPTNINQNQ